MIDDIGTRLRRWRQRRGLTQRALAELAGFTQGYVAQIELGLAPLDRRSSQLALADALQISLAELTGQPGDPSTFRHSTGMIAGLRAALLSLCWDLPARAEDSRAVVQRPDLVSIGRLHAASRFDRLIPAVSDAISD